MAAPWWLGQTPNLEWYGTDTSGGMAPRAGEYRDLTTGKLVYEKDGKYYYELPKAEQWGWFGDDTAGGMGITAAATPGVEVPKSMLDSTPTQAQFITNEAKGILAPYGNLGGEVGIVDGKPTYLYPMGRQANIDGGIGTYGGAQVASWTSPSGAKGQVVQGPDGAMWVMPPADAIYGEHDTADHSSVLGNLAKDFGPLAMAALPFTGAGTALSGLLGGGTVGNAGASALINAGTSLLSGGDPIMGALKGGAGSLLSPALADAGVPSSVAPFITNAAISGATGGDVGQSLLNTAVNTGVKGLGGLFSSPGQDSYQYTMSGGEEPSSVSVENVPQDMTGFQTPQSTDPAQIWQTPDPLANLNQPPASDYLNAPVSGAPNMALFIGDNSGGWTPDFSTNSLQSLWPTSGDTLTGSPVQGTPADNYMNSGNLFDYNGVPMGGTYNFNTGGYDAGTATPTISPGVLGYLKQALGIGTAAGGVAGGMGGGAGGNAGSLLGGNGGLLLPLLGGLLGSMSGGAKPAGTTTTVNDIPDWQKPYVTNAFGAAGNALNDANAAYAATKPTTDLATNNLNATLRGDYLGSNPALDGMFNTAANSVANKVNSAFSSAGRYGSGAQTSTLTEGLGNLANNIYGQNYQQERQRQFAGSLAAPSYSQGVTQAAYSPASGYANIVRQPVGNTQSSPYFTNPLGGAVSGLLGGYALSRA